MADELAQVNTTGATADHSEFVLSDADLARELLDIVTEIETAIEEAGSDALSSAHSFSSSVEALRKSVVDVAAGSDSREAGQLKSNIYRVEAALSSWLEFGAPAPSETIAARARSRLETWRVLGRPIDALVDFDALLRQVMKTDSVRLDAEAVELRIDVLAELVREQKDEVLGSVPTAISDLASARAALISFLVARGRHEAPDAEAGRRSWKAAAARTDPATTPRPANDRTDVGSTDPTSASADVTERRTLEAHLMEAMAAADQLVSGAIERASRAVLSRYAANLRRTELQLAATDGLAQVIDERLEIRTNATIRLAELLRRMKGGSVGLAGARGAGKSTIIRRFRDGRERIGDRPLLSVMIPAPVVYDSREFTLHLFAEVCRAAGARPPPPEPSDARAGQPSGALTSWALATARAQEWWLRLPALWLILGGIAALVLAIDEDLNDYIVWGAAFICGGVAAWAVGWTANRRPTLNAMAVLIGIFGAALVAAGIAGVESSVAATQAAAIIAVGLVLYIIAVNVQIGVRRRRERSMAEPEFDPRTNELYERHRDWLGGGELVSAASLRLEELRYQQSLSVGMSGKIGLPLGIEVGANAQRTLARHPMMFPEVVADLQRFLALASKTHDVLVAIDELDKLESDDDTANQFLNDLKAAFGVPNTYFLVSVSEDAMSRFERRGLPFRDVFDSTFDEIVRVEPLSLAEAQRLLSERVVGLPYIYSGLCHVMAGGSPRGLIRIARRIIEVNDRLGTPDTLSAIVAQLIMDDLLGKADAVELATIALDAPDDWLATMLEWVRGFRVASASRTGLMDAASQLHQSAAQFDAARELSETEVVTQSALRRLTLELGTYGYFAATALDFFSDALTESQIDTAANGAGTDPTLECLARARMAFAVSARTAWLGINGFRAAAGLQPASLPIPPVLGRAGSKL